MSDEVNEQFLNFLNSTIEFGQSPYDPLLYMWSCPPSADGRYLLKVFVRMVGHPKFKHANSVYRKDNNCLRFHITFRGVTIEVECGASYNQPGNARIKGYGPYEAHKNTDLGSFALYFKDFLQASDEGFEDDNWKLAVLQLFEIARRIPAEDIYHDIPIALGIAMGLEVAESQIDARYPTISTKEYFDLFRGDDREQAYKNIRWKYEAVNGPLIDEEAQMLLEQFLIPNTNSDDEEDELAYVFYTQLQIHSDDYDDDYDDDDEYYDDDDDNYDDDFSEGSHVTPHWTSQNLMTHDPVCPRWPRQVVCVEHSVTLIF